LINAVHSGWMTHVAAVPRPLRTVAFYLLAAGALVGALILWAGRGQTFFADDWAFIVGRRGWTSDAFLQPHNEHISVVPVAIYKLLFEIVGLHAYWPYRCVLLLAHLACVALVFRLARRRVGDPTAALTASFLLVLGSAWEILLFPFAINLLSSVAFGLLALDGQDRGDRRGDIVTVFALIGAACSSSAGVPFLVGVTIELALRRSWRKLWIVGIPTLLYGAWWLEFGRAATARDHLLAQAHAVPRYVLHSLEAAVSAAVPLTAGSISLVLALALLLALLRVARNRHVLTPRFGGLVAAGLTFWSLTGLARAHMGVGANRYPYFGVVFLLLAAVELSRGMRLDRRVGLALCVLLAASAVANLRSLELGGAFLRGHGVTLRAELTALSRLDSPPPPDFHPEPTWDPNLRIGDYLPAVRDLGSPVESASALQTAPEGARAAADRLLLRAAPPTIRTARIASCAPRAKSIALAPHAQLIRVTATASFTLRLRLFASRFSRTGWVIVKPGQHDVLLPAVHGDVGWHAAADGAGRICT
jgi:hypothetical protein